jgi:DNA-binding protein Fis
MPTSTSKTNEQTTNDSWGFTKFSKLLFSAIIFVMIVILGVQYTPTVIRMLSSGPEMLSLYLLVSITIITVYFILKILKVTLVLNRDYDIGTRKQKECGVEYVEASTGRYSIWSNLYANRESKEDLLKPLRRLIWLAVWSSFAFIGIDMFIFHSKNANKGILYTVDEYSKIGMCCFIVFIFYVFAYPITYSLLLHKKYDASSNSVLNSDIVTKTKNTLSTKLEKTANKNKTTKSASSYLKQYAEYLKDAGLWSVVFFEILLICVIRYMLGFAKKDNVTSFMNVFDINLIIFVMIVTYIVMTYTFLNKRVETLVESLSKYNILLSNLDRSYKCLSSNLNETAKNILTKTIVFNIKHEEHADGNANDILKNYDKELSTYITHKKGNELNDVYVLVA